MGKHVQILAAAIYFFIMVSCSTAIRSSAPEAPEYFPTGKWRISSPESQGLDSKALSDVMDFIIKEKLPVHSLMVIRHGYIVLDAYFYPYSSKRLHDVASVTKCITATLVGLALQNGFIEDLDQPMADFFPEYEDVLKDKKDITVRHLLTMTSGFECGRVPGEKELFEMMASPDWVAFALQMNMVETPGKTFSYCSNGMHLLSAIVGRATGMSTLEFARKYLFSPLGIQDVVWPADPQGVNLGGGDLRMHPLDMAKIGYLYLHKGRWDDRQILSPEWVNQAAKKQIPVGGRSEGYGYGWWTFPEEYEGMFGARGRGGQEIIVWPRYDLVLVLTAGGADIASFANLLVKAIQSNAAIPNNSPAAERLEDQIRLASMAPQSNTSGNTRIPEYIRQNSGKRYRLAPNRMGLEALSLAFDGNDSFSFTLCKSDRVYPMNVGLNGDYKFTPNGPSNLPTAIKGSFKGENRLLLNYREVGGINNLDMEVIFEGNELAIHVHDPAGYFNGVIRGLE